MQDYIVNQNHFNLIILLFLAIKTVIEIII